MDYVLRLIDIPWWFFLIAIGLNLIFGFWRKNWALGAFIGYLFLVISETIIIRKPFDGLHFQPELFWSYRVWDEEKGQIIANVIMFIPFGIFGGKLWKWRILIIATVLSLVVETVQLLCRIGLFEFDDIIHNFIGVAIGFGLYEMIRSVWRKIHDI